MKRFDTSKFIPVPGPFSYEWTIRPILTEAEVRRLMAPLLPAEIKSVALNFSQEYAWVRTHEMIAETRTRKNTDGEDEEYEIDVSHDRWMYWLDWWHVDGRTYFRYHKAGEALNTALWIGDAPFASR